MNSGPWYAAYSGRSMIPGFTVHSVADRPSDFIKIMGCGYCGKSANLQSLRAWIRKIRPGKPGSIVATSFLTICKNWKGKLLRFRSWS
jgi:hypothetical protein